MIQNCIRIKHGRFQKGRDSVETVFSGGFQVRAFRYSIFLAFFLDLDELLSFGGDDFAIQVSNVLWSAVRLRLWDW